MKEVRYFYVPEAATQVELPAEEATHALRVLRLKGGDEIFLMDGEGSFYRAEVTAASSKRCLYEIKETMPQKRAWKGHIHLAIAPTKMMERIEWMAEKATEIGFDELSFLNCQFSERKVEDAKNRQDCDFCRETESQGMETGGQRTGELQGVHPDASSGQKVHLPLLRGDREERLLPGNLVIL